MELRIMHPKNLGDLQAIEVPDDVIPNIAGNWGDIPVIAPEPAYAHPRNLHVEGNSALPGDRAARIALFLKAINKRCRLIDRNPRVLIGEDQRTALERLTAHEPARGLEGKIT